MYKIFSLIYVSNIKINKKLEIKCIRCFHETIKLKIKTQLKVNEYLLNRNISATEILNNLSKEDAELLKEIKSQHQILLTDGKFVPKLLNDSDFLELMCLSFSQRRTYFKYLAKKESRKEKNRARKLENACKEKIFPDVKNTFFGKYYNKMNTNLMNQRVIEAIVLKSQEIVFDFSYESEMTRREIRECAKQFKECFGLNRKLADPYQIGIINFQQGSIIHCDIRKGFLSSQLSKYKDVEDLPLVSHKKPLIETYPDKRIIYLSPNSLNTFEEGEYDHNAIYIISLIVEKGEKLPLSLTKAEKERMEHRSFPLDRYVKWVIGDKTLPLNQVFNIMSIARETNGDWCKAIRQSLPLKILSPKSQREI